MSERERLAFLSGAETMAEEIAKAVEQSEYQWAAHYAAFIRALPLLKPDEAALLRASAPPADVAGLINRLKPYAIDGTINSAREADAASKLIVEAADALAAMAAERDRWKAMFDLSQRTKDRWVPCPDHRDKVDFSKDGCPVCHIERLREALEDLIADSEGKIGDPHTLRHARAALGGSDA